MERDGTQGSDSFEGSLNLVKLAPDSLQMLSDKPMVRELIQLLLAHNVTHCVLSPGSRNAPISISLINHPEFETYSVVDERAAGFFALGLSQQLNQPVAVCCTSGSAAMNYAPAVAEAFYQRIPLIVLTADRPQEWVNQGDGQTIQQKDLFGSHVRSFQELRDSDDDQWHNNRLINEALNSATAQLGGPVHINIPLYENLYGTTTEELQPVRVIRNIKSEQTLSDDDLLRIKGTISASKSVMILCGQIPPNRELNALLASISEGGKTIVLSETHSNVCGGRIVTTIDRIIMSFQGEELADFMPETLITIGGNIISKKIKAILRDHPSEEHYHVDSAGEILDTYKNLTEVIPTEHATTLAALQQELTGPGVYADRWALKVNQNQKIHDDFAIKQDWSDLKAFNVLLDRLPQDSDLQMGNSSVVRYVQLFDMRNDIRYFGNRGTSGIDGCTSTAMGAANASDRITTLIVGDLSFLYDTNGLWHQHKPANLKIIVINNGGGGIFKIIDGPSDSGVLTQGFETPHQLDLGKVSAGYNIDYQKVKDEIELSTGLEWLYSQGSCSILEIDTSEVESQDFIKAYFTNLRKQ
jgi:2-succinyl-5-enolpyruvyl-6-hydroxy-3-cyclohexene-1-carboxylate synthase